MIGISPELIRYRSAAYEDVCRSMSRAVSLRDRLGDRAAQLFARAALQRETAILR